MKIEDLFLLLPTHIYCDSTQHRLICYPWLDGCGYSLDYEGLLHVETRKGKTIQYLYELMHKKLRKTDYFVKKESYGHISLTDDKEHSTGKTFEENIYSPI